MNKEQLEEEIAERMANGLSIEAEELWKWLKGHKQQTMIGVLELMALQQELIKVLTEELEPPHNYDLRYKQSEFYPMSTTARPKR